MAITIDGQVKRNACEQIEANKRDIEELKGSITTPKFVNIQGDAMDNASLASKLNEKVDKETGKGLSEINFTHMMYDKLASINMSTKQDKLSEDQMKAVNSGVTQETFDDVVEVANEVFNREYKLETDTPTKLTIVRDDVNKRTKLNITVEGGGGGEPAAYIKNIAQIGSTYTAYKKDDSSVSWTIPDVSSFTTKTYVDNQDNAISISLADEINERKAADEELEDSIEDLEAEMPNKLDKTAARIKTVAIDENKITFTKVDDTTQVYEPDIPQAMTYKGSVLQANLPTTGMQNGDYYKLKDTYPSQYYGQCAIWDSSKSAWDYSDSNVNLNNYYTKTEVNEGFATKAEVNAKQDTIADLETIRTGAGLGATAVQPAAISDMATKTWVEGKGYLTEHQSLAAYRTSAAQDIIDNGFEQAIRDEESEREAADSALQDNIDLKQDKLPEGEDGKYLKAELDAGSGSMSLKWADVPAGPDTYIKTVNLGTANRIVFTKKDDTTQQFDVDLSAYRTAANQDTIDETFVKLTGDQTISGIKTFGEVWVKNGNKYAKLFESDIQREANGSTYNYMFPTKSGTFAMTSDVPDLSTIKQAIYDGIYPVNNIQFGFQAPGVPEGVTATWTDVSSTYNGRYFKVSSTSAAGTSEAESLPLPSVSLDTKGEHKHNRGDMNITGLLRTCPSADSNVGDTMPIKHASGAFYNAGTAGSGYQRVYDINASYSRDTNSATIGFNAASNWTGETSQNGGHSHTATVSGTPYASGAAVRPLTTTIKVFKRTA